MEEFKFLEDPIGLDGDSGPDEPEILSRLEPQIKIIHVIFFYKTIGFC
jgi:hypothetical protein